jgi:hypothetical protein
MSPHQEEILLMSTATDIFVDSHESLEDFVGELESLLNIKAKRFSRGEDIWYELKGERTLLIVVEHDLVNDSGMNFEDYRYEVEVSAINIIKDPDERLKWQNEAARMVFNKLKEMGKYPILLVDNLQVKLDAFHPS